MTNDIILSVENNEPVVSSRQISESFGKNHKDVLESIRTMTAENSALLPMFHLTEYTTRQNKKLPMYLMNRDGFSLLVMGFTGKAALEWKIKYIDAFNTMEKKLTQPKEMSRSELISRALIAANEEIHELTAQNALLAEKNEELTPKGEYYDRLVDNNSLMSLTDSAKALEVKPKTFINYLIADKFLYRRSARGPLLPYEEKNKGYFEVKDRTSTRNGWSGTQTLTTVKGREKFMKMRDDGYFD